MSILVIYKQSLHWSILNVEQEYSLFIIGILFVWTSTYIILKKSNVEDFALIEVETC